MKAIKIHLQGNTQELMEGVSILQKKLAITLSDTGVPILAQSGSDRLVIKKEGTGYTIHYSEKTEFFRGLALLCAAFRENKEMYLCEQKRFKTVGSMLDLSRGYVFKKEVILDLLEYHAVMGLNMFMLYTEDTYELEGYPWFGYLRGRYSKEELKEIDDYADKLGIQVIPCIQTLGHLATTLRWQAMTPVKDTANELLVGVEETYVFIEKMISTMRECFRSDRIHIGMDEAMSLGKGRYKTLFGVRSNQDIMIEHLERVNAILDKYHYKPMIWSDMFFRMSGKHGEYDTTAEIPSSLKDTLPKNVEMVYWDYCMEDRKITDKVIAMHKEMERPVVFAGGIWTWGRTVTGFKKSFDTAREQLISCAKNGLDTVFATIWESARSDFSLYSILPALQIWAELSYQPDGEEALVWERFRACTGYNPEDWKLLYADDYTDEEREKYEAASSFCINSVIQHFYHDSFFGFLDKTLAGYDFKSKYDYFRKAISKVQAGDMQPLFDRHRILYEIVYIKCDFGPRIRAAYAARDFVQLQALAEEAGHLAELYRAYRELFLDTWFDLCKPFGYGLLDKYFGGVEARALTVKKRLEGYLQGKYESLEELEEAIMPYNEENKPLMELDTLSTFWSLL